MAGVVKRRLVRERGQRLRKEARRVPVSVSVSVSVSVLVLVLVLVSARMLFL
ncbi:hypothetical protein [Rhodoferax antarcticus]|uniref:hypothetical protein n=1 Tax=Rhodoferax antarcticus TaxID=81479 RepID=UPI0022251302|nr:hypothetical protein [Rhodoferax antarcticus]MCW2314437.1 hypothetical protein [Rhodoferax antarcticus]